MAEDRRLLLSEEQLNLINLSVVKNIRKCIPEITERFTLFVVEKIDTHLKQFWSQEKRNEESYLIQKLNKKQHISYTAITNCSPIYLRKEKNLSANLQDLNDY